VDTTGRLQRGGQELDGDPDDLLAEIARLTSTTRTTHDVEHQRRLLRLRHLAGISLTTGGAAPRDEPSPAFDRLPDPVPGDLPSFALEDVSAEVLRAAILRDGCMIVRGFIDPRAASAFALEIDRAFAERECADAGEVPEPGYYEPFECIEPYTPPPRGWIKSGGGLLVVDSPRLAFELVELYDAAGISQLVTDYLGGPAIISAQKTTLRKTEPTAVGAWHQDGAFMGLTRSLNLWVSLSHCGLDAPSLDVVPRRLDQLAPTGTEGAFLPDQVSDVVAQRAAGSMGIVRPTFAPGDVAIFDDLFLHRTGADAGMTSPRYAIESWFFAGTDFPLHYAPVAISTPPTGP
jgi:hypothetical protein